MEQSIGFVTTSEGRVAYATVGRGPAILCDTGWVSHRSALWQPRSPFRRFFEPLAARHTLVFYDKPGTGLSERHRTAFTPEVEVEALEAVVDRLGLEEVSLLGMSQGGPIVALYAARHPDRVGRVVLYGTYARGQALATPEVQRALAGLCRASWGLGSEALAAVFVDGTDAATHEWFAEGQRVAADAETAARLLEMNYVTDVSEALAGLRAPTLVIHREQDRCISFDAGREVASLVPGARLTVLPGSAHIAYVGDWQPVLAAIQGFLDAPAPAGGGPLTAREAQVAGLVAEGLTNGEIAQRLAVAPRTVDAHLEHIRNKLGFRSRTQVGVWAAERRDRPV